VEAGRVGREGSVALAALLSGSDRAPGLLLGDGVELPASVIIGGHVIIHAGTRVGERVRIQDAAVLGKPVVLGPRSSARRDAPAPLEIDDEATVCVGAVVLAGARIGRRAVIGDQAHVRERAVIGEESVVGRDSAIDNDVAIGARVRIQSGCYLTAFTVVEDDVFVAPGVYTTNDNTMGRRVLTDPMRGATLRRACRVGSRAVLLPGIEIGEEAFVAAGSVVTRDVPARSLVMGSPARVIREIEDAELLDRWR
jgi:acetyltransferase-like isoleucine patch superfamily enzyme